MSAPTIATEYQIGIDNALIQVPQNYTVPANPPALHNPPLSTDTMNVNGVTKDSVTIYVSAIHDFSNPLLISFFVRRIDKVFQLTSNITYNSIPNTTSMTVTSVYGFNVTDTVQLDSISELNPTSVISTITQITANVITVAGNIPSDLGTSAFTITDLTTSVDPALDTLDETTVPVDGDALPLQIGTSATNMQSGVWNATYKGWAGYINNAPNTGALYLTPNASNALSTYTPQNYITLWLNPNNTGGAIDPNHPPSYQVNLFALDTITNTYASCNFTLVVLPSVASYGLGVFAKQVEPLLLKAPSTYTGTATSATATVMADTTTPLTLTSNSVIGYYLQYTSGNCANLCLPIISNTATSVTTASFTTQWGLTPSNGDSYRILQPIGFINSVALPPDGSNAYYVEIVLTWYPLEPAITAPASISVTSNILTPSFAPLTTQDIQSRVNTYIIDIGNTTINGITLATFTSITLPANFTRNAPSNPVLLHLTLSTSANPTSSNPVETHGLIELLGTDANGVSASAYTGITVVALT
jgi:hypothetical protein